LTDFICGLLVILLHDDCFPMLLPFSHSFGPRTLENPVLKIDRRLQAVAAGGSFDIKRHRERVIQAKPDALADGLVVADAGRAFIAVDAGSEAEHVMEEP